MLRYSAASNAWTSRATVPSTSFSLSSPNRPMRKLRNPSPSPTCNGTSVAGIGRSKAQQVWYRALTVYFTSTTDYAGARTATLAAARDLYGSGSAEVAAVAAAWSAVAVD